MIRITSVDGRRSARPTLRLLGLLSTFSFDDSMPCHRLFHFLSLCSRAFTAGAGDMSQAKSNERKGVKNALSLSLNVSFRLLSLSLSVLSRFSGRHSPATGPSDASTTPVPFWLFVVYI